MASKEISKIAGSIKDSSMTVALTGAGISTESGIADFRSPGGIWSRFDPGIFTRKMLYGSPELFYKKGIKLMEYIDGMGKAKPNQAHLVLADLEKKGLLDSIITQNIDGLHLKAGSKKVLEIHGDLLDCYCIECGLKYGLKTLIKQVKAGVIPPTCNSCKGMLRPSIVLFGDMLPDCFHEAIKLVKKSEFLMVIGSSLEISPANTLLDYAKKIAIINDQKTAFDDKASVIIRDRASRALLSLLGILN